MNKTIRASLVGMRFYTLPFNIYDTLKEPVSIELHREPQNQHDCNAVAVIVRGYKVGHLDRESASMISPILQRGAIYRVWPRSPGGIHPKLKSIPINIKIELEHPTNFTAPKITNGRKSGIYKILINNGEWLYIGQSNDINKRIASHWKDLFLGVHANKDMQSKWGSFGPLGFSAEVVEYAVASTALERQRWLGDREIYWISHTRSNSNCLNRLDGEIVTTNKALKEYNDEQTQRHKRHDLKVKERKKELNALLRQKHHSVKEILEIKAEYRKLKTMKQIKNAINKLLSKVGIYTHEEKRKIY